MAVEVRPVTEADIRDFITWRYEPPYDGYSITGDESELVAYFMLPSVDCHALVEGDALVGFCTFGADAQVPGGDYQKNHLDIGLGIRPDLTGRGLGADFVATVIRHALAKHPALRVTIAQPNERAIRVWESNGFRRTQIFRSPSRVMGAEEFGVYELVPELGRAGNSVKPNPR